MLLIRRNDQSIKVCRTSLRCELTKVYLFLIISDSETCRDLTRIKTRNQGRKNEGISFYPNTGKCITRGHVQKAHDYSCSRSIVMWCSKTFSIPYWDGSPTLGDGKGTCNSALGAISNNFPWHSRGVISPFFFFFPPDNGILEVSC